jgi:hypothetical protein
MRQESLLPGTDALPRGTIEWTIRKGKHLIRYRRPDGTTWQRTEADPEAAQAYYEKCIADLREQAGVATEAQRHGELEG